jgi:hypothetical protein
VPIEELARRLIRRHPVLPEQKVVDVVGEDELLDVDVDVTFEELLDQVENGSAAFSAPTKSDRAIPRRSARSAEE